MVCVNLQELTVQILLDLLKMALTFDGIWTVNVDIVDVCGSHIWITY